MKIEQIYTGCLAEAAYYIESNGEAVIIDPLRETKPYLDILKKSGAKLKYIFETHFHADFVSGHIDLAKATGAEIVFGPNAKPKYDTIISTDGQIFKVGDITLEVLHTPGHTMESSTFLLKDENGTNHAIFSGDTLFLGDVGRPDLAVKSNVSQDDLAGYLFDSLRNKIMPLEDDLIVYPGHGAGSACGKNLSKETVGTLGEQKKTNYALNPSMTKEEFVKEVTDGLLPPPQYFPKNAMMNINGYESIDKVLATGNKELSVDEFEQQRQYGALVLDVRSPQAFAKAHIKDSIFIGIDGSFAPWVGALITDINQPIILIAPEGREEETVTRLARIGYDNTQGYLKGGFTSWQAANKEIDSVKSIPAEEFIKNHKEDKLPVIDVRKDGEFLSEHVVDAFNSPLDFINKNMVDYPNDKNFYIHCAGGYRSMIAASILKSRGVNNLIDIQGGFGAIKNAGAEVTAYVCPSTL